MTTRRAEEAITAAGHREQGKALVGEDGTFVAVRGRNRADAGAQPAGSKQTSRLAP
jgi:hypothetical protein